MGGLPHSDIHGSTPARGSPWLFAACHVLHRLLVPRHPPNALLILIISRQPTSPPANGPGHAPAKARTRPNPAMHRNHPHPKQRMKPIPIPRQSHSLSTHFNAPEHCNSRGTTRSAPAEQLAPHHQHMGPNVRTRSQSRKPQRPAPQVRPPLPARHGPPASRHATPPHKETAQLETHRDVLRAQRRTRT